MSQSMVAEHWMLHHFLSNGTSGVPTMITIESILIDLVAFAFLVVGVMLFWRVRAGKQRQTWDAGTEATERTMEQKDQKRWQARSAQVPLAIAIPALVFLLIFFGNVVFPPLSPPPTPTPHLNPSPTPHPAITPPTDLLNNGVLTVGTSTTYPPQSYVSAPSQKPVGFDIDLITQLATEMNLKVEFIQMNHTDLISNLSSKQLDVVIGGYQLTDGIKAQFQAVPYLAPRDLFMIQKNNPKGVQFKKLSDLCALNIIVGALQDSAEYLMLKSLCVPSSPLVAQPFPDGNALFNALAQGKVAGVYADDPTVGYYTSQQQFKGKFMMVGAAMPGTKEAILIRQDDGAMFNPIANAFRLFQRDGKYSTLLAHWTLQKDTL